MRAERERAHFPQVALAGYTNAGKSTLLNALTGAEVGVRDRLFHTLDPTTRVLRAGGRDYLLTDTVGFIRKLPHQLVEAFGATLEETRAGRPDPARRRRLGAEEDRLVDDPRGRGRPGARSAPTRCRGCWCWARSTGSTRRAAPSCATATRTRSWSRRSPARGSPSSPSAIEQEFARRLRAGRAADPVQRGRAAGGAARARRRPRARGHAGRRARQRAPAGAGRRALRAVRGAPSRAASVA